MLGRFKWLRGPGKLARSPKPFKNETRLAKLQPLSPRAPAGSPRPPYPGSEQLPGAQTREADDRRPRALRLPCPARGGGAGRRAASRCSSPRRSRSRCRCGRRRRRRGRQIGAGEPSGRRGGRPQPSRRRGPGEGAARAARIARPGPSGRSPLTSANFLGPLGGSERTGARAPGSPRPGWASRLLVWAPGHPPSAARARWQGASPPPCTPLQVNAEAKSSCHLSRSPSGLLSLGLIGLRNFLCAALTHHPTTEQRSS